MKLLYIFSLILASPIYCQVGINEQTPLASLHVSTSKSNNPEFNEGVIIPIVKSLNVTDEKSTGLLVFLDYEDSSTPTIEKGFYWWNGTKWIPFFSMNKLSDDLTVTYVSSLDEFSEGNITSNTSTNIRTIQFNPSSLKANDSANFSITANGELLVKKAGTYHIQATISLNSFTDSDNQARDSFEAIILKNGSEPTPTLRTAYGFPNGQNYFNSNSVISGYIKLNADDKLSIRINRYYRKANSTVTIKPNGSMTNLTLRYMGEF